MTSDAPVFDADQHYYEAEDAFQRHLPEEWRARTVQVAVIDGRVRHVIGGRLSHAVSNPTFDPIVKPGALAAYFRGNPEGRELQSYLAEREPLPQHYRDPAARVDVLDEQGIEATWMLPSLGMSYEQELEHDPQAAAMAFRAFNRWLAEDWSFNYKDRLYAAPYLVMADPAMAAEEVDWAVANGARLLVVRPAAVHTASGWRSPADPCFDPVWARIDEAGITVVAHIAETGGADVDRYVAHHANQINAPAPPLQIAIGHERAIETYLAALVCGRLFDRFPRLRIASVENGASFLPRLLAGLHRAGFQRPGYFREDPVETFTRHIWVTPFWEDDLEAVLQLLPADRVLFGSDWPHAEGLRHPREHEKVIRDITTDGDFARIMHDNAAELMRPPA